MAIDRDVTVSVCRGDGTGGTLMAPGLTAAPLAFSLRDGRLVWADPDAGAEFALFAALIDQAGLATAVAGCDVTVDSRALHENGRKLGLGSSAAVCVALARALGSHAEARPSLGALAKVHRATQDGRGSGIDLAAAWHGGLFRFEPATAAVTALNWPATTTLRMIDTGVAQSTGQMLARLATWRRDAESAPAVTAALVGSARAAAAEWAAGAAVTATTGYAAALQSFDAATGLGIYSHEHRLLDDLAHRAGVAYKPSGAGGGDIGIALSDDPERLEAFDQTVRAAGFAPLPTAVAHTTAEQT